MSDNKEAGRLILADLKMFDAATVLFGQEIFPAIMGALDEAIQNWAKKRDWHVEGTLEDYNLWLTPSAQCSRNQQDKLVPDFKFAWYHTLEDDDHSYSLANFCGIGTSSCIMWFEYDVRGKTKAVRSIGEKYAQQLKKFGFSAFDKKIGSFYLPLQLDASKLADAWMNDDYDELSEPLVTALDNLERAVPTFEEFMLELRSLVKE